MPSTPAYLGASASFFPGGRGWCSTSPRCRDPQGAGRVLRPEPAQIQRLFFATKQGDRIARRRLQELLTERYINRTQVQVLVPGGGSPAPVYYPAQRGCDFLADYTKNDHYRLAPTQTPQAASSVPLARRLRDAHRARRGAADQARVSSASTGSTSGTSRTRRSGSRRSGSGSTRCSPIRRVWCACPTPRFFWGWVATRRCTTSKWIGARPAAAGRRAKTPGYAALAERQLHRRHFPDTTLESFTVLCVAPSAPPAGCAPAGDRRRSPGRHCGGSPPRPTSRPSTCCSAPSGIAATARSCLWSSRRGWRHEGVPEAVPGACPPPD